MENNSPFQLLGKQLKTNIPHVTLGNNGIKVEKPNQPIQQAIQQEKSLFNSKEQDFLDKLRKWGLIIAVTIILCYAGYRIIA